MVDHPVVRGVDDSIEAQSFFLSFIPGMDTTVGGAEEANQARMATIANSLQTQDAMQLYNWVSQRCFSDCVASFYRKALGKREEACVRACVHKFLLLSSARFADPSTAAFDD